jgi:hypothetical protein
MVLSSLKIVLNWQRSILYPATERPKNRLPAGRQSARWNKVPCARPRLVNDDIVDLYDRAPVGTKVVAQHR